MVYDLQTRKILSLESPPPPQLIARPQPDNPPSESQMSPSNSLENTRDVFTPPPALDAAADLIRCINDVEVLLGFIKNRAIRHLVIIQGVMMNTWSYPVWKQNNGELVPISVENLQLYMLEWELEGPNCFCPLIDPSLSLVQTILHEDDIDRQWSFICTSKHCSYHAIVNLSRVFSPGLPQSALHNYASCNEDAPPIEDLDYRSTFCMHSALSDIEEGVEAETMSAKAPGSVVPESDEVLQLKEKRWSPQAQKAGDNSAQTGREDFTCETDLIRKTILIPQWRELWIHLTQKAEGVTSEELAGLLPISFKVVYPQSCIGHGIIYVVPVSFLSPVSFMSLSSSISVKSLITSIVPVSHII
ncbi:hypothetical protein F5146DRAFT_1003922 [Armillaria mellea]|nr:hypothetical protein F5146DRAFT_1003922 [Armillaria mellea]